MIKRDRFGFVVQHSPVDPAYADGGDSCARAGLLAMTGSETDRRLLRRYLVDGLVVRHPLQDKWCDPKETSRDNLICYFAAQDPSQKDAALFYARHWFVNKDFLDPSVRLYLYKCAGVQAPLWLRIFGNIFMALALNWNCYVKPNEEQNQFLCLCFVMGSDWVQLFQEWHPNLYKNISEYWDGWRDQHEIGSALLCEIAVKTS